MSTLVVRKTRYDSNTKIMLICPILGLIFTAMRIFVLIKFNNKSFRKRNKRHNLIPIPYSLIARKLQGRPRNPLQVFSHLLNLAIPELIFLSFPKRHKKRNPLKPIRQVAEYQQRFLEEERTLRRLEELVGLFRVEVVALKKVAQKIVIE